MSILNDCLTGIDGVTYDPARVYGLFCVLTYLGLAIYSVAWKGAPFDYQGFGIGFGAVLAGFGASVSLKSKTEPCK
jgi:hypothetical protein